MTPFYMKCPEQTNLERKWIIGCLRLGELRKKYRIIANGGIPFGDNKNILKL